MRLGLCALLTIAVVALAGCGAEDDGSVTNDANELNEGRGALEREMDPQLDIPENALIGADIAQVLTEAKTGLTAGSRRASGEDCTQTDYKNAGKKVIVEHLECESSVVIRILDEEGLLVSEHSDYDRNGKVDRYSGTGDEDGIVQVADVNLDGKIDLLIERVDRIGDFTTKPYGESHAKSKFLHRIREDRDRDGQFDHEKLTARGALVAKK